MRISNEAPPLPDHLQLDTCGGRVRVEWDPHAPVTPLGQLIFLAQFLTTSARFDLWVKDCPWVYTSANAPAVREVCGTLLLSVLSGHHRYAHVSTLRGDRVNAPLLGMSQVVSEDSVRRALAKGHGQPEAEAAVARWQQHHLRESYGPLLSVPWILDIDSTVKTIYGHQEGAQVGYNPHKRGRPSHVYHTYLMGAARLVLDVEVQPGKQTAAQHALPGMWRLLDALPASAQPTLLRGDCAFGQEGVLAEAEARGRDYLFKLRLTRRPKDLIRHLEQQGQWQDAGQGWQGREGLLQLQGWSRARRVVVLRRPLKTSPAPAPAAQRLLDWPQPLATTGPAYEYAVLVTSLKLPDGSHGNSAARRRTEDPADAHNPEPVSGDTQNDCGAVDQCTALVPDFGPNIRATIGRCEVENARVGDRDGLAQSHFPLVCAKVAQFSPPRPSPRAQTTAPFRFMCTCGQLRAVAVGAGPVQQLKSLGVWAAQRELAPHAFLLTGPRIRCETRRPAPATPGSIAGSGGGCAS